MIPLFKQICICTVWRCLYIILDKLWHCRRQMCTDFSYTKLCMILSFPYTCTCRQYLNKLQISTTGSTAPQVLSHFSLLFNQENQMRILNNLISSLLLVIDGIQVHQMSWRGQMLAVIELKQVNKENMWNAESHVIVQTTQNSGLYNVRAGQHDMLLPSRHLIPLW